VEEIAQAVEQRIVLVAVPVVWLFIHKYQNFEQPLLKMTSLQLGNPVGQNGKPHPKR